MKTMLQPTGITVTEDAKKLGVTREHLSRVLHGHRVSASLLKRYELLQPTQVPKIPSPMLQDLHAAYCRAITRAPLRFPAVPH